MMARRLSSDGKASRLTWRDFGIDKLRELSKRGPEDVQMHPHRRDECPSAIHWSGLTKGAAVRCRDSALVVLVPEAEALVKPFRDRYDPSAAVGCPGNSDVHLFGYCKRIIHFDAKISNGAFDFRVAQQQLHGA